MEYNTEPSPTPPHPPDPRAWLGHFPATKRASVANWFHTAARDGAQTPQTVCSAVWQTAKRHLAGASAPADTQQFLQGVLVALRTDQVGALRYTQSVLEYEALPREQRQRVKAQRALTFLRQQAMQGKAVTPAQGTYLRALGHKGTPPADRAEASHLIDQLRQQGGGR